MIELNYNRADGKIYNGKDTGRLSIYFTQLVELKLQVITSGGAYTGYDGLDLRGSVVVDKDFIHRYDSLLAVDVPVGAVTAVSVSNLAVIPPETGEIVLNSGSNTRTLAYTSWTVSGDVYTFVVDDELDLSFTAQSAVYVAAAPLMRTEPEDIAIDTAAALFTIPLDSCTRQLQELLESKPSDTATLELLVFRKSESFPDNPDLDTLLDVIRFSVTLHALYDYRGPSPDAVSGKFVTSGVASVNGQTGVVDLDAADVNAAAADHTHSVASTSAAGYLPQLPGDSAKLLDGSGSWSDIPDTTALEAAIAANSTAAANAQDNLLLNANGKKPICQRADAGMFTLGSTTLAAGACSFDLWRVLGSDYIPDVIDNAFYFAMSSSDGYVLQSVSDYAPLAGKTLSYSVKIDMANAGTLTVNDNLVELVNVPLAAGVNIISGTFTMSSSPDGLNFAVYSPTAGYVKIHYASLVEGSVPAGEIAPRRSELRECMEHGHLISTQSGGIVQSSGTGIAIQVRHLVRMRRVPDISFVAPAVIGNGYSWEATQSAVGYSTPSGIPYLSEDSTHLYLDNFTGLTVNDSVWLLNGHLWLDAGIN